MDGAEALRHLCKWLGEEAALPLEVLTSLEKKLAEEQVFQVEDLMLLRDEGMLQTVFSKHVTRRKVEMALDRRALQASGQQAGVQRAGSGWAAGERERSPAAGGGEAETTPPRVLPQPPRDFRLPKSVGSSGASARRSLLPRGPPARPHDGLRHAGHRQYVCRQLSRGRRVCHPCY